MVNFCSIPQVLSHYACQHSQPQTPCHLLLPLVVARQYTAAAGDRQTTYLIPRTPPPPSPQHFKPYTLPHSITVLPLPRQAWHTYGQDHGDSDLPPPCWLLAEKDGQDPETGPGHMIAVALPAPTAQDRRLGPTAYLPHLPTPCLQASSHPTTRWIALFQPGDPAWAFPVSADVLCGVRFWRIFYHHTATTAWLPLWTDLPQDQHACLPTQFCLAVTHTMT